METTFSLTFRTALADHRLTQKRFSEENGIPLRTIESWIAGIRTPPEYVQSLVLSLIDAKYPIT